MNLQSISRKDSDISLSDKSDDISNLRIKKSLCYKIFYITTNILLIITYIVAFLLFILMKKRIILLTFFDFIFMQTNIICFLLCMTIHFFLIIFTLYNAFREKDYDFKKLFYSDKYYFLPLQNILFILNYACGILLNFIADREIKQAIRLLKYFFVGFLFLLIFFSYANFRKNKKIINLSYISIVSFMVQAAVIFSLSLYLFLYSILFIFQSEEVIPTETIEILTVLFEIIYALISISLIAKKDIFFSIIYIIINIGCILNSYRNPNQDFQEIERITLYSCMGLIIFSIFYISFKYRKQIFKNKRDEDLENLIHHRSLNRLDKTI